MGVNNRQRRAAKRRKRANARNGRPAGSAPRRDAYGGHIAGFDERAVAARVVLEALAEVQDDPSAARVWGEAFTGPDTPVASGMVAETVDELLVYQIAAVLRGGWTPSDLGEIVRRRLTARHQPPLAALLEIEAERHPADRVAAGWRADLTGLGRAEPLDLKSALGLELAFGLCSLLGELPEVAQVLPPPGSAAATTPPAGIDTKRLARVRALLAKAESTEYAEEAEALSAKAQELISRYALGRLADQAVHEPSDNPVSVRRLWIDPPYVMAKAMLINAVAGANRCRAVISEQLGFSTLVGEPADLEAVDLMATSLLVQADAAMLAFGSQVDMAGTSRTKSFRRSFLIAYASRIGERLREVTRDAAEQTGRVGQLLPVLRRQAERVEEACDQLFPRLVTHETSITNDYGWAAGRAAADLALLDANGRLCDTVH
jgi:hypothetical protein